MKKFRYTLICNKEYCTGKIKALNYEKAVEKLKMKFQNEDYSCLRVYANLNIFMFLIDYFLANISTIVFKIITYSPGNYCSISDTD